MQRRINDSKPHTLMAFGVRFGWQCEAQKNWQREGKKKEKIADRH